MKKIVCRNVFTYLVRRKKIFVTNQLFGTIFLFLLSLCNCCCCRFFSPFSSSSCIMHCLNLVFSVWLCRFNVFLCITNLSCFFLTYLLIVLQQQLFWILFSTVICCSIKFTSTTGNIYSGLYYPNRRTNKCIFIKSFVLVLIFDLNFKDN